MTKLVRDNIPEIIENQGKIPVIRTADKDELLLFLFAKLIEETLEVVNANDNGDIQSELADVLQVVYTIARETGISPRRLEWIREAKVEIFGPFDRRVIWYGNQETP